MDANGLPIEKPSRLEMPPPYGKGSSITSHTANRAMKSKFKSYDGVSATSSMAGPFLWGGDRGGPCVARIRNRDATFGYILVRCASIVAERALPPRLVSIKTMRPSGS